MANFVTIEAEARARAGKGAARATRRAGRVPAVIYGAKQAPTLISLEPRAVLTELKRGGWRSRLFELKIDGVGTRALMRDVQFHPVTDIAEHVDFQRLAPGEEIRVSVAVHYMNEATSPGLKKGGVLNVVRHTVEVWADPEKVPAFFEADLGTLDINDNIRWHDLKGTEVCRPTVTERDFVVATVAPPTRSAEAEEPAAAAAAPAAAPAKGGKAAPAKAAAAPAKGAAPAAKAPAAKKNKSLQPDWYRAVLLWVGLGNPEPGMARQRHNIGFMAIDRIAQRHGFSPWRQRFKGAFCEGVIGGEKVGALKPLTYMNASGESVQAATAFYKLDPAAITAFHDELDLVPGKIRVKRGGGAAGHNGLRSMDRMLGSPDYWRVRLGIGHPGDKARVLGWVLGDFAKDDANWLGPTLDAVADEAGLLVAGKPEDFMTRVALLAGDAR